MRTSFRGSDEGGALALAAAAVLILSLLLVSFAPRAAAKAELAEKKLARVLEANEEANRRLGDAYDLH